MDFGVTIAIIGAIVGIIGAGAAVAGVIVAIPTSIIAIVDAVEKKKIQDELNNKMRLFAIIENK